MYDEFVEDYEPTKADSYRKKVVLDGEEVCTSTCSLVMDQLIMPQWISGSNRHPGHGRAGGLRCYQG